MDTSDRRYVRCATNARHTHITNTYIQLVHFIKLLLDSMHSVMSSAASVISSNHKSHKKGKHFGEFTSVTLPDKIVTVRIDIPVVIIPAVCRGHPQIDTSSIAVLYNLHLEFNNRPSYIQF